MGLLGRLCQYALRLLGVVAIGGTHCVVADELGLIANLHVVLVSVEPLTAFLHPSGVDVLVALLVGIVVASSSSAAAAPEFIALALLYLPVLLARVALPRGNDKTRVDNLALVHNQSYTVEITVESLEQLIVCPALCQRILVFPHGFLVGNIVDTLDVKKVPETRPIFDVVFYLWVAHAVKPLQEQHLEHEHRVEWLATCITLPPRVIKYRLKNVAELLEVYDFL